MKQLMLTPVQEHKLLEQSLEVMKDLANLILHMKNMMARLGQQAQP